MIKLPLAALIGAVEILMDTVPPEQVPDVTVEMSYNDILGKLEMHFSYAPSKPPEGVCRYGH